MDSGSEEEAKVQTKQEPPKRTGTDSRAKEEKIEPSKEKQNTNKKQEKPNSK